MLTEFKIFVRVLTVDRARFSITNNTFTEYYNYSFQLKLMQTTIKQDYSLYVLQKKNKNNHSINTSSRDDPVE